MEGFVTLKLGSVAMFTRLLEKHWAFAAIAIASIFVVAYAFS
jgi:hypothetical protein